MVGSYTEDIKKKTSVKIGRWVLTQGWPLAQDNAVLRCKYTLKELDSTREVSLNCLRSDLRGSSF